MRFKPIYDVAQRHDLFVTNMDVGKGREQDAVSFARHSKDRQYSFSLAQRPRGAGLTLSAHILILIGISQFDKSGLEILKLAMQLNRPVEIRFHVAKGNSGEVA
jgi:hypothetical protein